VCFRSDVAAGRNMTRFFFITFAVGGGYCVVPAFIRFTGSTTIAEDNTKRSASRGRDSDDEE
jgi:metallophosphoesterase superfamily enzyme